jgi:hypothetical protein
MWRKDVISLIVIGCIDTGGHADPDIKIPKIPSGVDVAVSE